MTTGILKSTLAQTTLPTNREDIPEKRAERQQITVATSCAKLARMTQAFIDTHIHLTTPPLASTESSYLKRSRQQGVGGWIVPAVSTADWPQMKALCQTEPDVVIAPGLHPRCARQWNNKTASALESLLDHPATVAVGEIGLDATAGPPMALQEKAFQEQLHLANEAKLPLILHCHGRWGRLFEILAEEEPRYGGVLHGYSRSIEMALRGWEKGFAVGIGGVCTWPNARKIIDTIRQLPAEAIVLETDAPSLSDQPHRRRIDQPDGLKLVAAKVAEIRGWTLEKTAQTTFKNVCRLFPQAPFN